MRDGSRKRICRDDLAKAANAHKRNADNSEDKVIIPYSDLIHDLVSNELSRSVAISFVDPDIDESLRSLAALTSADLKPFVTQIANRILDECNYRFIYNSVSESTKFIIFYYVCAQDSERAKKTTNDLRDRVAMERAKCNGSLSFKFSQISRLLTISANHIAIHPQYVDIRVKPAVRDFVEHPKSSGEDL